MNPTIQDLRQEYLNTKYDIEESTKKMTDMVFRYFLEAVGDVPLNNLTREHAEQFMIWLLKRYPKKTTVVGYIKTIRPAFRWALYIRRYLNEDIFAIPLPKVVKERDRTYSDTEAERLLKVANPYWKLRILFGLDCGLRKGEILNLRFDDIDLNQMLLHVQPRDESYDVWGWYPKGKRYRTLPLPERVAGAVRQRKREQPYVNLTPLRYGKLRYMLERDELTSELRKSPDQNFTPGFKRVLQKAGIQGATFHDLRRTFASRMAHEVPSHVLAYLVGDTEECVTKYYVRIDKDLAIEKARRFINRLERNSTNQSGRQKSNLQPRGPQPRTLTKLSYAPFNNQH